MSAPAASCTALGSVPSGVVRPDAVSRENTEAKDDWEAANPPTMVRPLPFPGSTTSREMGAVRPQGRTRPRWPVWNGSPWPIDCCPVRPSRNCHRKQLPRWSLGRHWFVARVGLSSLRSGPVPERWPEPPTPAGRRRCVVGPAPGARPGDAGATRVVDRGWTSWRCGRLDPGRGWTGLCHGIGRAEMHGPRQSPSAQHKALTCGTVLHEPRFPRDAVTRTLRGCSWHAVQISSIAAVSDGSYGAWTTDWRSGYTIRIRRRPHPSVECCP